MRLSSPAGNQPSARLRPGGPHKRRQEPAGFVQARRCGAGRARLQTAYLTLGDLEAAELMASVPE